MSNLISTTDACVILGCHKSTLLRIAKRLNLGQRIGVQWVWRKSDLPKIAREIKALGNPLMGPDQPKNYGKQPAKQGRKKVGK